ncbi:MAG: flagellar biosynthetic protein FliO [Clostridiales bacterium]|nr:flagellar biosynthetic protein FliO [Clostridiales bacterium]
MSGEMYGSLVLSLLGVVAVIAFTYYVFHWLAKRYSVAASCKNIKVIERAAIGKDKFIIVADICGGRYILGVTPQQFTLLKDLGEVEIEAQPVVERQDFISILGTMIKKRVGKGVSDETEDF